MKILVTEDHTELLYQISTALKSAGYVCEESDNFESAKEKIHLYHYDIIIVDVNLPDGSGIDLIKEMKQINPETGIIVITARNSLENKIEGLELGADDYITKPFDLAELIARIRALSRRKKFQGNSLITFGKISLDALNNEVSIDDERIDLTKSEYKILYYFFSNPKRVLTREGIAEYIWGDNMDMADSFDFVYSHLKNLRKKITKKGGHNPVKAIYGVGYKLNTPELS